MSYFSSEGKHIPKEQTQFRHYDQDGNEYWEVDKIIDKKQDPHDKKPRYLVSWKGFGQDSWTWEPIENLETVLEEVDEFERNLKEMKKGGRPKKATPPAKEKRTPKENLKSTRGSGRKPKAANSRKQSFEEPHQDQKMNIEEPQKPALDAEFDDDDLNFGGVRIKKKSKNDEEKPSLTKDKQNTEDSTTSSNTAGNTNKPAQNNNDVNVESRKENIPSPRTEEPLFDRLHANLDFSFKKISKPIPEDIQPPPPTMNEELPKNPSTSTSNLPLPQENHQPNFTFSELSKLTHEEPQQDKIVPEEEPSPYRENNNLSAEEENPQENREQELPSKVENLVQTVKEEDPNLISWQPKKASDKTMKNLETMFDEIDNVIDIESDDPDCDSEEGVISRGGPPAQQNNKKINISEAIKSSTARNHPPPQKDKINVVIDSDEESGLVIKKKSSFNENTNNSKPSPINRDDHSRKDSRSKSPISPVDRHHKNNDKYHSNKYKDKKRDRSRSPEKKKRDRSRSHERKRDRSRSHDKKRERSRSKDREKQREKEKERERDRNRDKSKDTTPKNSSHNTYHDYNKDKEKYYPKPAIEGKKTAWDVTTPPQVDDSRPKYLARRGQSIAYPRHYLASRAAHKQVPRNFNFEEKYSKSPDEETQRKSRSPHEETKLPGKKVFLASKSIRRGAAADEMEEEVLERNKSPNNEVRKTSIDVVEVKEVVRETPRETPKEADKKREVLKRTLYAKESLKAGEVDVKGYYKGLVESYLKKEDGMSREMFLEMLSPEGNFKEDEVLDIKCMSWEGKATMNPDDYYFKVLWKPRKNGKQMASRFVSWKELSRESPEKSAEFVFKTLLGIVSKYGTFGEC